MTPRKLAKLERTLGELRARQARPKELVSLAKALGRKKVDRGKEPTYESEVFSSLYPLTIPNHPGDMAPATRRSVLNQLEDDVLAWKERLEKEQQEEKTGPNGDVGER